MQKNDILHVTIEAINNLGYGVGHTSEGQVVFVKNAVTADELDARIIKVTKSYLVARIEHLHTPSPFRSSDACLSHACGGCVYQNILYEHELSLKRDYVRNAFRKAGLSHVEVKEVRSTGVTTGYRNKAQYPVANGKSGMVAGFYASNTHRLVEGFDCRLQPPVFGEILRTVCSFCDQKGIVAYEEKTERGLLRHIYLRNASKTKEVLVTLVINGKSLPHEKELATLLMEKHPMVVGVLLNVNEKNTNVVLGQTYRTLAGRDFLEDELLGLRFRISSGAFYQVNHDACELLYTIAKETAHLSGNETLLDLYCGIGTIGLSMAHDVRRVIGIEIVEEAVERAKENAARNGLDNAFFACGDASDAERLLENAERAHGDISDAVVIMDPPRKGSTPELIDYLARRKFLRIVYISCSPDTLARDCARFEGHGYTIGTVTPVDLFPRTGHVECVVSLTRTGND